MKCLVTGASGFVGRELCDLLTSRGETLVGLSRSGQSLADGTLTRALDLCTAQFEAALFDGVDVVYHLAGIAHQRAQDEAYHELNYLATLRLARAACSAGVRHFVFLSSVKAMGPSAGDERRSEPESTLPVDAYGLSKWQAERDLRGEFSDSAMAVTILRPALVYGRRARGNLELLTRGMRWGLPRPPEEGGRSMVAVQDLVGLLHTVVTRPDPGVATWIVTDGQDYSTRRIYDVLRRASGKSTGYSWWPLWLWHLAARGLDLVRKQPESTWEKLFSSELYSSEAVQREMSWRPRLQLEDVIGSGAGAGIVSS